MNDYDTHVNHYNIHVNLARRWVDGPHSQDKVGQVAMVNALLAIADRLDRLCEIESKRR